MTFWIVAAALTVLALAILLAPLLRSAGNAATRADHDLAVYRAQLDELESEVERGVISESQAESARVEIQRRMLAAGGDSRPERGREGAGGRPAALTGAIAVLVPVTAVLAYLALGAPGTPDLPFADRQRVVAEAGPSGEAFGPDAGADIKQMVETLARRLEEQGSTDARGWQLLGRSYAILRRYDDAAKAYARAHELSPDDVEIAIAYGETLIFAEGGAISEQALAVFNKAAEISPGHPGARYYLALAKAQDGDVAGALDDWVALAADTPADAGWRGELERQIRHAADQLDRDVAALLPPSWDQAQMAENAQPSPRPDAPGPTAEDVESAAQMSAGERRQMIQGMVSGLAARLADDPADPAGWQRLIRAYRVLGESDKARAAIRTAARHNPGDADIQVLYAQGLMQDSGPGAVPDAAVTALDRALEVAPDHRQGLWLRGLAAESAGETDRAAALWRRLLGQLPEGSADYQAVERRLQSLGK